MQDKTTEKARIQHRDPFCHLHFKTRHLFQQYLYRRQQFFNISGQRSEVNWCMPGLRMKGKVILRQMLCVIFICESGQNHREGLVRKNTKSHKESKSSISEDFHSALSPWTWAGSHELPSQKKSCVATFFRWPVQAAAADIPKSNPVESDQQNNL